MAKIEYKNNRVFVYDSEGKRFIYHIQQKQKAEDFYNSLVSKAEPELESSEEESIDFDFNEEYNGELC